MQKIAMQKVCARKEKLARSERNERNERNERSNSAIQSADKLRVPEKLSKKITFGENMGSARVARVDRKTKETDIFVELNLDGTGRTCIDTGVPFFDHMLDALGRHGLFDLSVHATGDTEIDAHHTVEDTGIVLGTAFLQALGTKEGINRFGNFALAMDEALVLAALDFSGRGGCWTHMNIPAEQVGNFDTELGVEFFKAFASNANMTLHVRQLSGENSHHILEAAFKALGRALKQACERDPRITGVVPSTKGAL